MARILWLPMLAALLAPACAPREPGPTEADYGKVSFWLIESAGVETSGCTDAASFTSEVPTPEGLIGSTLSYRIADDGQTAELLDCTSTDPASCASTEPARSFEISGHVFSNSRTAESPVNATCNQQIVQTWTFEDGGEELSFAFVSAYALVGDATSCAEAQQAFVAGSSNGEGIDGCTLTVRGDASFTATE